ncbi:tetratricopeptide repeat protein [Psychromonas sp.]|uniref:tetratricopeptide repeat protein n=1 Tax=Psychromonas sp. TaxID=1884585 RepID=UPI003562359F
MVDIIEGYETEEQQVDAIKQWWKENGNTLIIAAVVGLAGLWGWRFYNESVISSQEEASQAYTDTLVKVEQLGGEAGLAELQTFVANNQDNNYGVLAALLLAKEAVEQKDFALAKAQFVQLQTQNEYAPLNALINLRLARVEAELGEYSQALQTLALITDESFLAKANQVKGSIYLKQGELEKARSAFQDAVNATQGNIDPVLQLQFDDLAGVGEAVMAAPILDTEK